MSIAGIYVRVSTEDQARHGYSLAAQADACRERAEQLGAREVRLFADEGVSGALLARPGLDGLREAVRDHRLDLVVVWDPDRLSRNLSHQLLLTEEIEAARVRLEFVNFEWKATPEGQLFYALRGAIAQYEKEKIRERTGRGRLQKARQGKLPLACRPYGYSYNPATSLLEPDPVEAPRVRDIFRWFREDGEGPGQIANRLNALGVPARKGGRWHRAVIRQILANPVYAGRFYANRWDTAGCSLNRHLPPGERVSARQRPEGEWVPVAVPALVEPEAWQEAQALLSRARQLWAGRPRAEYLLSGLVHCGRCGRSMSGFAGRDWGVIRRKYTCRRSHQRAGEALCRQTVLADEVEAVVWERLLTWLAESGISERPGEQQREREADLRRELAAVAEAITRAESAWGAILAVLEQGALEAAEASAALGRVAARLSELAERRDWLRAELARLAADERGGPAWAARVREALTRYRRGELAAADRKRLCRMVLSRVVVADRTAVLYARWPAAFAAAGLEAVSAADLGPTERS